MDGQLTLFGDLVVDALDPVEDDSDLGAEAALEGLRVLLEKRLKRHSLGDLVLTDNQSTILSSRSDANGRVHVRLHWSFAAAPDSVVAAAARIVEGINVRRSRTIVREWVEARGCGGVPKALEEMTVPAPRRAPAKPDPAGRVHDLARILDEVNARYFEGRHRVAIGWSRAVRPARRRRVRRHTIQLGSWSADDRRVLVHPVLDHRTVPRWVVAAVVHHELLHADMDPVVCGGRRRLHTPEFRRREREFEHHDAARRWIDRHLESLLRRRARRRNRD